MSVRSLALAAALASAPLLAGCQSVYYDTMEVLGREKRDLLQGEIRGMVGDQRAAEAAFVDALTRVKGLTAFEGGDLERAYDRLSDSADDARAAVADIDDRMEEIVEVASDLFVEWALETEQIQSPELKASSRAKLRETRLRYDEMVRGLQRTRRSMDPVLTRLNDNVLYLKHNLNAAAIGSLGTEMRDIETGIQDLRASIEASIREAESFIQAMP